MKVANGLFFLTLGICINLLFVSGAETNIEEQLEALRNEFEAKLAKQENEISDLQQDIEKLKQGNAMEAIGFTVYIHDDLPFFASGETIKYHIIGANVGGYYNNISHTFECPYTGLYLFSASLTTSYGGSFRAAIVKEGSVAISVWPDNLQGGYHQSSGTVLIECEARQRVWVEVITGGTLYGIENTAFSGVLVSRMD